MPKRKLNRKAMRKGRRETRANVEDSEILEVGEGRACRSREGRQLVVHNLWITILKIIIVHEKEKGERRCTTTDSIVLAAEPTSLGKSSRFKFTN